MSAIFKDGNGFWRDVAKEKEEEAARVAATPGYYDELLPKTPGQGKFGIASGPNQNVGLEEVLKTKKIERADIDTFKGLLQPAMAGGVDAQAELVGILSDPNKPKEARAAAAEVLYPGVEAGIGRSGEMSFRAAPGSDLGFNYPNKTTKASEAQAALGVKGGSDLLANLSESVRTLQGLANTPDIVTLAGQVSADLNTYASGKRNELKTAAYGQTGVSDLEAIVDDWKQQDQLYYLQNTGGKNIGPSQETTVAQVQLATAKAEAEKLITEALAQDPEYAAIAQQQQIFASVLTAKTNQTMIEPQNLPEGTAEYMAHRNMNPLEVLSFQDSLSKGNPQALANLERFNQPVATNLVTLLSGNVTATDKPGLISMMEAKLGEGGKELLAKLESTNTAFETTILPKLTPEEQTEYKKISSTAKGVSAIRGMPVKPDEQKAAKEQLIQYQVPRVMASVKEQRDAQWRSGALDWSKPEDPILAESWDKAVALVKAKQAKQIEVEGTAEKGKIDLDPAKRVEGAKLARMAGTLDDLLETVFTLVETEGDTPLASNMMDFTYSNTPYGPNVKITGTSQGEERKRAIGVANEHNIKVVNSLTKFLSSKTGGVPGTAVIGGVQGFTDEREIRATLNALATKRLLQKYSQAKPINQVYSGFGAIN